MTTRTSCSTQRDWVSFGTLERRGKVSLSSPSFQLFKPINSRKLSLMKSLFSMSTDPSPSFFLLKSFHQKCARAHKFAKTGRYASEEENGQDMCQIQAPISFRE